MRYCHHYMNKLRAKIKSICGNLKKKFCGINCILMKKEVLQWHLVNASVNIPSPIYIFSEHLGNNQLCVLYPDNYIDLFFFFSWKTKYLLNFLDPFFFFVNPDLFPNYIMLWYNDPICTIIPPLYTQTPPIWAQILFDRKFFHGLVHYTFTHTSSQDTIYVVLYIDYIIAPNTLINPKWLIFSTPFPFAFYLSTN